MNALEQLKQYSTIVADTGDIEAIKQYLPQDTTTNPSLILKAASLPTYQPLIEQCIQWVNTKHITDKAHRMNVLVDKISVAIGSEILNIIPGRISTEIDASLSFDYEATIRRAEEIIALYHDNGFNSDRILIKIAATWEGIQAAKRLEQRGIQCNLTLLFGLEQAKACADAGVALISPFVGRVLDWYKANTDETYTISNDPGVASVKNIYSYYKQYNYKTIVMAASFRSAEQVLALTGCDYLTISPTLLKQLSLSEENITPQLRQDMPTELPQETLDESQFRWQMNTNAMATEQLAQGIRSFNADLDKLKTLLSDR